MFAGGARRALTKASPWLALAIALAMVWYVTKLQLPASLEFPFKALLILLTAACSSCDNGRCHSPDWRSRA